MAWKMSRFITTNTSMQPNGCGCQVQPNGFGKLGSDTGGEQANDKAVNQLYNGAFRRIVEVRLRSKAALSRHHADVPITVYSLVRGRNRGAKRGGKLCSRVWAERIKAKTIWKKRNDGVWVVELQNFETGVNGRLAGLWRPWGLRRVDESYSYSYSYSDFNVVF